MAYVIGAAYDQNRRQAVVGYRATSLRGSARVDELDVCDPSRPRRRRRLAVALGDRPPFDRYGEPLSPEFATEEQAREYAQRRGVWWCV